MPEDGQPAWSRDNRDLLIKLSTQVDALRQDVKDMRDNTQARLALVENGKLDRTEANRLQAEALDVHADFETRLRFIERYMWLAMGVITLVTFALNFVHPSFNLGVQ